MIRRNAIALMFMTGLFQANFAFAQGNLPGLPPLEDRFEQTAPAIGGLLPDLTIVDDYGNPVAMRELPARGRYTVLTVGCLT